MQSVYDQLNDVAERELTRKRAADEETIRAFRGHWVSQIEPCVARD